MYVKPTGKQIRGMYVPENYRGTTFTEPEAKSVSEADSQQQSEALPKAPAAEPAAGIQTPERTGLSSLFSGIGNIRSDDLLLLALILLLSKNEGGEHSTSEILPLLALLLFMG